MNFNSEKEFLIYLKTLKEIGFGSTGICYLDKNNNKVLKVFHQFFDEIEEFDPETHTDYKKEEILRFKVKTNTFVFPTDVIKVNQNIVGYITNFINATSLYKQNPLTIDLDNLVQSIIQVQKDIMRISKEGILTYDMMYNILYGKSFFIIDSDEYSYSNEDPRRLAILNNQNFNYEIFYFLIEGFFDEFIKNYTILNNLYNSDESDILIFLKLFREKLSEVCDKKIITLNDAKICLNKKRTNNPIYQRIIK